MNAVRVIIHLMYADFLERTRSYRFMVTLLFMIFFTYFFVPAMDAPLYGTLYMKYRGIYCSAWIGTLATLLMSEYLLIFGFFLVKGSISRDQQTGVGEIIAATPISRHAYTLGKWLSHSVYIAAMLAVMILTLMVLQILRAEDLHLNFWALASPILILLFPAFTVVAGLAVLFESINWLRGIVGNLIYFFLVYPLIAIPTGMTGAALLWPSVYSSCSYYFPDCNQHFLPDLSNLPLASYPTFVYSGIQWTMGIVLGRLLFVVAAIGIALIAASFFHRFDPARIKSNFIERLYTHLKETVIGYVTANRNENETEPYTGPVSGQPSHLTSLGMAGAGISFWRMELQLLVAEWKLAFSEVRWWWYVGALLLITGSLFAPLRISLFVLLPIAWIWPLGIWSSMGNREVRQHTEMLIFSCPHPLGRQFLTMWGVGLLVTLLMAFGLTLRFMLAGAWISLAALFIGVLFVPTLALAMGSWSGTNKLFEATYLFFWYLVAVQNIPYLDFMGRIPEMIRIGIPWIYGSISIGLFGAAVVGRRRQIIH